MSEPRRIDDDGFVEMLKKSQELSQKALKGLHHHVDCLERYVHEALKERPGEDS